MDELVVEELLEDDSVLLEVGEEEDDDVVDELVELDVVLLDDEVLVS